VDDPTEPADEASTGAPAGRRRGWVSLYAAAFALMVGAGVALAASSLGTLRSIGLLRLSAWLSAGAIVVAVASVALPRRR
jgi:hypothetical protein